MNTNGNMVFNAHHVKVMKVALAIVIIRQKPSDISLRKYIERLSLLASGAHLDWKKKADSLSKELLQLKQEPVIEYMNTAPPPPAPGTAADTSDTDSSPLSGGENNNGLNEELQRHICFIQCISRTRQSLQSLPMTVHPETMRDTLIHALEGINQVITEYGCCVLPVKCDTLTSSIETIVEGIKNEKMTCYVDQLLTYCVKLSKTCIDHMQADTIVQENSFTLQQMVLKLSFHKDIWINSLKMLIEYITVTVQSLTDSSTLVMDVFDSLGACIRCAELLLVSNQLQQCLVPKTEVQLMIEKVESVLFEVNSVFPLVGFSLWRIHGLSIMVLSSSS